MPLLLAGEARPLAELPEGATVVWGLIAGITDGEELCGRGLGRLADAAVARVVPVGEVAGGTLQVPIITWGGDIATILANGNALGGSDTVQ